MTDDVCIPAGLQPLEQARFDDPCRTLWAAVICQAAYDLDLSVKRKGGSGHGNERLRETARWWFTGADTGFEDVCYVVGVDPDEIRRVLWPKLRAVTEDADAKVDCDQPGSRV